MIDAVAKLITSDQSSYMAQGDIYHVTFNVHTTDAEDTGNSIVWLTMEFLFQLIISRTGDSSVKLFT